MKTLITSLALCGLAFASEKASEKSPAHPSASHGGDIHWGYEGLAGPVYWGDLKPEFLTCKAGKTQSPINIVRGSSKTEGLSPLSQSYQASPITMLNNGHTVQFAYAPGSSLTLDGKEYKLLQFHFHTPSEEQIDGKNFAMDAHFVHKSAEGKLAVIGLLFQVGAENPNLKELWNKLPASGDTIKSSSTLSAKSFMPSDMSYWTFDGSLTTPPCSEEVKWIVLKTPVTMSEAQLKTFRSIFPMNARPVQPLNGREVKSSN